MSQKYPVYKIDNGYAVRTTALCRLFHYSNCHLTRLLAKKVLPSFKYKNKWYVFIPRHPIKIGRMPIMSAKRKINPVKLPSGDIIYLDWDKLVPRFPKIVYEVYTQFRFNFIFDNQKLFLLVP